MAALPGVYRTVVGYCGGHRPNPSYKAVCGDPAYGDYAEAISLDYDPSILSYDDVLDAFFRCHDAISGGRSRQYSSIIFCHDEGQQRSAERAVAARPRVSTTIEAEQSFWAAEPYHQKWLLQRKRPLMAALGLQAPDELLWSPAATVLNAAASRRLTPSRALQRLEALVEGGELSLQALENVRTALRVEFHEN